MGDAFPMLPSPSGEGAPEGRMRGFCGDGFRKTGDCLRGRVRTRSDSGSIKAYRCFLFGHIPFNCRYTSSTAMSAGLTPEIRLAWPRFMGRMSESFCRASSRRPVIRL